MATDKRDYRILWVPLLILALLIGGIVGAVIGWPTDDHDRLVTENRHLAAQVRELKIDAVADAQLQAQMAQDKLARDRQDQRTQRLLCTLFNEVLRSPPSIGTNSQGDLASDCADRPSHPPIPQRSQP